MVLDAIHVSQFYPCSRVTLAAELLYICELGKASYIKYGKPVSIDGVVLDKALQASKVWSFFRISVKVGWVTDVGNIGRYFLDFDANRPRLTSIEFGSCILTTNPNDKAPDYDVQRASYDDVYALSNPQYKLVCFAEQTPEYWAWDMSKRVGFIENNRTFTSDYACTTWVSFVAMCAVSRLYTGHPQQVWVNFTSQPLSCRKTAISYFLLLAEETNCFSSWLHYEFRDASFNEMTIKQLGYYAWYTKGQDLGLLARDYTLDEKKKRIAALDLQVGDFCFFYQRKRSQRRDKIKEIESCRLGRILDMNDKTHLITIEFITTLRTLAHSKKQFKQMTTSVQSLWSDSNLYLQFNTHTETFSLIDIGVEYCMSSETSFIVPIESSEDSVEMWVSEDDILRLSQNELIYWVCKEHNYQFNEERFKKKYFKNSVPLYDRYMRGDEIDEALFVK